MKTNESITYVVIHHHLGGTLHQSEEFLELLPFEFANVRDAFVECVRQRDNLIEKSTDECKESAMSSDNEDEWECRATVKWGPDGDIDIFRTCMFGYRQYD